MPLVAGGCSADGPDAGSGSAGPSAGTLSGPTVQVTQRDILQTVRLEGVVQRVAPAAVRAPEAGTFIPAPGHDVARQVKRGDRLGFVRRCLAEGTVETPPPDGDTGSDEGTGEGTGEGAPAGDVEPTAQGATCTSWRTWAVEARISGRIRPLERLDVVRGQELATIDPRRFEIVLTVEDPAQLYRLTSKPRVVRSRIVGGQGSFVSRYRGTRYDRNSQTTTARLDVPDDVRVFEGLHVVSVLDFGGRRDVPTLPLSAVQGRNDSGLVVVVAPDGATSVREVELGAVDGRFIEVLGISPDEKVLLYPLESDFSRGQASDRDG